MLIRDATPADAPAIAAVRERTIRTIVAPLGLYSQAEIDAWAGHFTAGRVAGLIAMGHYLVAADNERVVGFARLVMDAPGRATIRGVFVDADHVGLGIGTRLVGELLLRGARAGVTTFDLVATLNARSFYERLGFTLLEQVRHTTVHGAELAGLRMRREAAARP